MSNDVFPALKGLSFPVIKQSIWSTTIQKARSGKEIRAANWSYPRYEIELPFEFLRDYDGAADLKTLLGFFNSHQAQFDNFLFDDPDDNFIAGQQIGLGDGVTTTFQMIRSYGGFIEPCKNLKAAPAPKIYLDGALQESGYTLGFTDSGLVTFTAAPGVGVVASADCGFYWRVRFNSDSAEFEKFLHRVWEAKSIPLITEK